MTPQRERRPRARWARTAGAGAPRSAARAAAALALVWVALVGAAPSAADELSEKRAQAERIARQLEEQSRRVSILAEDFDEARLRAEKVDLDITAAEGQVARTDEQLQGVRRRVRTQAVEAYVRGGRSQALELMVRQPKLDRVEVRHAYVKALTASSRDAIDELRSSRARLDEERARLDQARATAREALGAVEASRTAAAAAASEQQETLAKVQGELAQLVAAEARRRAEEQARRVEAEMAARRARELAAAREREAAAARARAALTTTTTTVAPTPAVTRVVTTLPPRTTSTTVAGGDRPVPPPAAGAATAVAEARRQIGKPYEWGSPGPDSFDCSGLTSWAWRAGGRSLPHSSRAQYAATTRVPLSEIQPGDLLFYGDPIHHVGIYAGNGEMVEASQTGTPVRMASIHRRDLVGVGRVN